MISSIEPVRLGVVFMLLQQSLFTVDALAIRHTSTQLSISQLGLCRSVGGLILVVLFASLTGWRPAITTTRPWLMGLRTFVTVVYIWVLILSYSWLPFADATALSYTTALYAVLFGWLILHERVGWWRCAATVLGLGGAILIIRPGSVGTGWLYCGVLVGTALNGLALVLNRLLTRTEPPIAVLFYVSLACAVMFIPGAFESFSAVSWPWLLCIVLTGPCGMFAGVVALQYAEAATLAPLTYVRLALGAMIGVAFLAEPLSASVVVGSLTILGACMLIYHKPQKDSLP